MNKDILVHKLESLTLIQKIMLLTGSLVLLGGTYWYFVLSPGLENLIVLHKNIAKINEDIGTFQKVSLQLPALKKQTEAKRNEFLFAQQLLPKDAQALERLLASFEMLGQEVGVGFMSFAPGKEAVGDLYATRTVSLRIQGGFHNLMRFFDKLSRVDRLVQLQSLRLQPGGKITDGQSALLTADSSLIVFRALSPDEIEAKASKKKKKKK